jgi:hypothetical protein
MAGDFVDNCCPGLVRLEQEFHDFQEKMDSKIGGLEAAPESARQLYYKAESETMASCRAMEGKYNQLIGVMQNALDRTHVSVQQVGQACADIEVFKKEVEENVNKLRPSLKDKLAIGGIVLTACGIAVTVMMFAINANNATATREMAAMTKTLEAAISQNSGDLKLMDKKLRIIQANTYGKFKDGGSDGN